MTPLFDSGGDLPWRLWKGSWVIDGVLSVQRATQMMDFNTRSNRCGRNLVGWPLVGCTTRLSQIQLTPFAKVPLAIPDQSSCLKHARGKLFRCGWLFVSLCTMINWQHFEKKKKKFPRNLDSSLQHNVVVFGHRLTVAQGQNCQSITCTSRLPLPATPPLVKWWVWSLSLVTLITVKISFTSLLGTHSLFSVELRTFTKDLWCSSRKVLNKINLSPMYYKAFSQINIVFLYCTMTKVNSFFLCIEKNINHDLFFNCCWCSAEGHFKAIDQREHNPYFLFFQNEVAPEKNKIINMRFIWCAAGGQAHLGCLSLVCDAVPCCQHRSYSNRLSHLTFFELL